MPPVHPCLGNCGNTVRRSQQHLICISCQGWQHRVCSIFTQADYRAGIIAWRCAGCPDANLGDALNSTSESSTSNVGLPQAESTAINITDTDAPPQLDYMEAEPMEHESMDIVPNISQHMNATYVVPNVNASFEVNSSFDIPERHIEDTIQDETLPDSVPAPANQQVTFELLPQHSQRGNNLLADSNGYMYSIKRAGKRKSTWRCKSRSRTMGECPMTVSQAGTSFSYTQYNHNHQPKEGQVLLSKISTATKLRATGELFKAASCLVEDVILDEIRSANDGTTVAVPNLVRNANRVRQRLRPQEPTDLNFDNDDNFIPEGFLQGDLRLDAARHMVYASQEQLDLLRQAKTWYMDGTFKVISLPFAQLFGVHAFLKGDDDNIKQVPLLFAMMSSRQLGDYKAVLECIKALIPNSSVKKFMLDFERAAWKAAREVYPDVEIQGCVFHWTQAVWRKVQELGLVVAYREDVAVHRFIRQLLALPYLPSEHIEEAFYVLADRSSTALLPLVSYIETTWITSRMWPPAVWSVFNQPIRTNNDVEGYHRRINGKAGRAKLPYYLLVPVLYKEAQLALLQKRLVKDGKLRRYQRRVYTNLQGRIMKYWEQYEEDSITTSKLIRKISKLVKV